MLFLVLNKTKENITISKLDSMLQNTAFALHMKPLVQYHNT